MCDARRVLAALRAVAALTTVAIAAPACGGSAGPAAPHHVRAGAPVDFRFPPNGNDVVSSETTRGRATALAFITTYDMVSQILVRRLGEVLVRFKPRANAAAVVLEAPLYAELLDVYREQLALPFPVVMADFATQQGQGPFGNVQKVPTLVVLDRAGREVWRFQGPLEAAEIEAALRRASSP